MSEILGLAEIIHFVLLRAALLQVQQALGNRRARLGGDLTCMNARMILLRHSVHAYF
jgi:hypothetical protein